MARLAVVVVDPFADWEPALLTASARSFLSDQVRWLSPGGRSVHSMGGLSVNVDGAAEDFDPRQSEALVFIGSPLWQTAESPDLSPVLRRATETGIVVAGICGATLALARAGLLDDRAHTSNSPEFLTEYALGYRGAALYHRVPRAVSDRRVVSAAGTASTSFAFEILQLLHPEAAGELAKFRQEVTREHLAQ